MMKESNHLILGGVDLVELASEYGTPLFVISERILRENCVRIIRAFTDHYPDTNVFYSYKTNYLPYVCRLAHSESLGAEVTSGFELFLAQRNQVPPQKIIFNGIGKEREAIRQALQLGIQVITVESIDELLFIEQAARSLGVEAPLGIRLNPGLPWHKDWAYKFGLRKDDALIATEIIAKSPHLFLREVHMHIGSQVEKPRPYVRALDALIEFLREIVAEHDIEFVNMGGGFPNRALYEYREFPPQSDAEPEISGIEEFAEFICAQYARLVSELDREEDIALALEPGRYIVSSAMLLLTSVIWTKQQGESSWAICDGGMNLAPKVREEYHDIRVANNMQAEPERIYSVGGPLCSSFDVIGFNRNLPRLVPGDLIAVMDMGAYSIARAIQFQYPRCQVVAIREGYGPQLVWRGETCADLIGNAV